MKKTLAELIKNYSDEEAVFVWVSQQPTSRIFELFSEACKARISKLESFRRSARFNAESILYFLDSKEDFDEQTESRLKVVTRQRFRAISGEKPRSSDYDEYMKKYSPESYKELHDSPEFIFVGRPKDLEKSEEEV